MRELMFNLLALAVFGIVLAGEQIGIFETPEARQARVEGQANEDAERRRKADEAAQIQKKIEQAREHERESAVEQARRRKEQKDQDKADILTACDEARKLPHDQRKKMAADIKKKLISLVESWGESEADVQWMQRIISTKIRPMRQ